MKSKTNQNSPFFFNTKHVDLNRKVSVDADKSDIFKVLDNIFAGTNVRYSGVDRKIILSTEKKDIQQTNQDKKITGVVKTNMANLLSGKCFCKGNDYQYDHWS